MANQDEISPRHPLDVPHNFGVPQAARCELLSLPERVLLAITERAIRDVVPSTQDYDPVVELPDTAEFARGCKRLANTALLHVCTQTRHVAMPVVDATIQTLLRHVTDEKSFWVEVAAAFEVKGFEGRQTTSCYANARARLRVRNEDLVWHLYSQVVWDVHLSRRKTYTFMGIRSEEAIKPTPCRLLDLPKELRLMIFKLVVDSSTPSARQDNKSDTLIPERDFQQRCASFSELPLVHTCNLIRGEVFPLVFDALDALARALQREMLVWEGIRDSLYGRIASLDAGSLDALQGVLLEWSRWSDYTNMAARTLVGWSLVWGDSEFRAVSLADAAASDHPGCSRRYRKGRDKSAGMHYEDF
ncbi:hypothetical protein LTR95_006969 [Oleoguttula sp. CCFEE 5521]